MNLCEHLLQQLLELLVLSPLIEFADKMPANLERVRGESQGCVAEVLVVDFTSAIRELPGLDRLKISMERRGRSSHHAAGVVLEVDSARVHQPVRVA